MAQPENIIYKDFDLSMARHPITDDVMPLLNLAAIRRSIRHLFLFNKYDLPFDDTQFSSIKQLLFEPISNITSGNLQTMVEWIIVNSEPRVEIISVDVNANPDETGYVVSLFFKVKSLNLEDKIDITLQRVR